jgi:hypothetical protein
MKKLDDSHFYCAGMAGNVNVGVASYDGMLSKPLYIKFTK